MQLGIRFAAALVGLAAATCDREPQESPSQQNREIRSPDPVVGNARDYGVAITRVLLEASATGVDARFEVENLSKSIVEVEAARIAANSEARLVVEVFSDGAWRTATSIPEAAPQFDELWPGGTKYARAMIPRDARWARVILRARGLVGLKDGAVVPGAVDLTSDALQIPEAR